MWANHIRTHHEDGVLTARILSSDEGYRRITRPPTSDTPDQEWLAAIYNRILDRAPDPAGNAYYLRRLSVAGSTPATRFEIAMALEHSASNARSWVKATMAEALGRPGTPNEVDLWTRWLTGPGRWQTFRLWTRQLSSDEAYQRAQSAA